LVRDVLRELNCSEEGDFLDSKFQMAQSGIYCLQGSIVKFVTNSEQAVYTGCPHCFKKIADFRLDGFHCLQCQRVVKPKHYYFIYATFQDFSGQIMIGFSRQQAEVLMNNIDAATFYSQVRKTLRQESDFEGWLAENVFFKTFKMLVKGRAEMYNGVNRLRFYALDMMDVNAGDELPRKAAFKDQNQMLLQALGE